ncbi:6-carboxyhexanoate/CoA ligase [Methanocaldococcus infernus ME]|uniref:6-carboxyhexanoate--CoA ligase n=2 Tax=Methanocaldococcus infernus TaxID=67760 RepID=BIOW_METIM|nr:RecName: Full=6-carboxyhexanoate--CoA ligase; AltName: Full=Pimeloyl-CoA synthase [Methanocaldococcus infernus ME]ADG12756.1 6-carboxyhexanoate/CoA ligase [Methanocaldococcus infernus ME]
MRASREGKHISGGERLVSEEKIEEAVLELLRKALTHENGKPDFINIKIEKIDKVNYIKALPIKTITCKNKKEAREVAKKILLEEGIPEEVVEKAFKIIDKGGMRGAAILNLNGERLEPDRERGVRVKNIDTSERLKEKILKEGLGTERTVDAIAIASKVIRLGIIAELCTSDNKSYTTGYVATKKGYFRITNLKNINEPGGRVFFVKDIDEELIKRLEEEAYIIDL